MTPSYVNGRVQGLVVGPWGDCSKDLHALIKVMGETKVAARARGEGETGIRQ